MGFNVSTLHNLPVGNIQYFIHVIDMSNGAHARWINENLHVLAAPLGRSAGLVTGPRDLSVELYQFLSRNLSTDFSAVERLLGSTTCLIISEDHLAHSQKPVYLIPVASGEETEHTHELITSIINLIAKALQANQLEDLVNSLGAQKYDLSATGGGFFVCNLRRLNKVLELKPNVVGIGLNLNATIEMLLPNETRTI